MFLSFFFYLSIHLNLFVFLTILINSFCCTALWYNYTYRYTCGNIINNNDERTHFFRKIYLSHFIRKGCEKVAKGLCVRGELETEQTATYWPQVPLVIAAVPLHSVEVLNRESWGPNPSAGGWFSLPRAATRTPTNWLQLTRTVRCTGLYYCLTTTCFLWASHLHRIQPVHMSRWYLRPDPPVSRLTAGSKVTMLWYIYIYIYICVCVCVCVCKNGPYSRWHSFFMSNWCACTTSCLPKTLW